MTRNTSNNLSPLIQNSSPFLKAYPEIFKDYYKMNELKASLLWLSHWIKCVKDVQEQCGHKSYSLEKWNISGEICERIPALHKVLKENKTSAECKLN